MNTGNTEAFGENRPETSRKEWVKPEMAEMNISITQMDGSTNDDGSFAPTLS